MENRLSEVNAEMWLNNLYPELMDQWTAEYAGTFWRNFSKDAMSVDTGTQEVKVARDGILKFLPQGFITSEDDLTGRDPLAAHGALKRRKAILSDAFLPFDTFAFRRRLHLEQAVSEVLESKETFILKHYFGIDPETVTDKYVSQVIWLLPFVREFRGNYSFVRNLLSLLLGCKVTASIGKYSDTDTTVCSLPSVVFTACIPGLDQRTYLDKCKEIKSLEDFIKEWFIPAEAFCEIRVCADPSSDMQESTLLDYNAKVN